jgi:hypothetical protein
MSNYSKATNFATKDSLSTGNPSKIVKGTEIDNEFNAIASAISSKVEASDISTAIAAAGGGKIVQSVVGTAGVAYTTSSSYTSTGMAATITPTASANKILVLAHAMLWQTNYYAGGTNGWVALYRNGANVVSGSNWAIVNDQYTSYGAYALSHLDSPASTSALTYAIYFKANGGDVAHNGDGSAGSIILLEIAA